MNKHSSGDLIAAARRQMESRGDADSVNRSYESLLSQFHADAEIDSGGLSQRIFELKQPGGLLPLAPSTTRGRIGGFFIRQQAKALWWLVRALKMRDLAMEAAYVWLRNHSERQTELERHVTELEARLRVLEGKSDAL